MVYAVALASASFFEKQVVRECRNGEGGGGMLGSFQSIEGLEQSEV